MLNLCVLVQKNIVKEKQIIKKNSELELQKSNLQFEKVILPKNRDPKMKMPTRNSNPLQSNCEKQLKKSRFRYENMKSPQSYVT